MAFQFDEDEEQEEASTKSATTESTEPTTIGAADMEVTETTAEAVEIATGTSSVSMEVESTGVIKTAAPPEADGSIASTDATSSSEVADVPMEGVDTAAAAADAANTDVAVENTSSKANSLGEASTSTTRSVSAETSAEVP